MPTYCIPRMPAELPRERGPAPNTDLMTAGEALYWIAYGEARPPKLSVTAVAPSQPDAEAEKQRSLVDIAAEVMANESQGIGISYSMLDRWGYALSAHELFVALSARAGQSPWPDWNEIVVGRFTPVEAAFDRPWAELIGPRWAKTMRALRARMRRQERQHVSYTKLREQLAGELAELQCAAELLHTAQHGLRGALASGRLTLFARRYEMDCDGVDHVSVEHEAVSAVLFMNAGIRIIATGQVLGDMRGCLFVDAMVRTSQFLGIWPATVGADSTDHPSHESLGVNVTAPSVIQNTADDAQVHDEQADNGSAAEVSPGTYIPPQAGVQPPMSSPPEQKAREPLTEHGFNEWYATYAKQFENAPSEAADMKAAQAKFAGKGIRKLLRAKRIEQWGHLGPGPHKKNPK
jgi:hypothetical protein